MSQGVPPPVGADGEEGGMRTELQELQLQANQATDEVRQPKYAQNQISVKADILPNFLYSFLMQNMSFSISLFCFGRFQSVIF